MIKNIAPFCFLIFSYFGYTQTNQSKKKLLAEEVEIHLSEYLSVETFHQEKIYIADAKDVNLYHITIPFDNFNIISDIEGQTKNIKTDRTFYLSKNNIGTQNEEQEDIFHSDRKLKFFSLPNVEDNSLVEYSYKNTARETHLLSGFTFQDKLEIDKATLKITCPNSVELGYVVLGNMQDKISFKTYPEKDKTIYYWEMNDIPKFEPESLMPSPFKNIPHIIYYIKKYTYKGVEKQCLNGVEGLYQWYSSLLKNNNTLDQTDIQNKVKELIQNSQTDLEKATILYNWVQQNLHYVAFEYEMGGFIPRDATEVFNKKIGDCKDMANLLNVMFKYAGLQSYLTWIGTRIKPYSYENVPTPLADNHMITAVYSNQNWYFFDATDKFCPATMPTEMIQDKEALIAIDDTTYKIVKVPIQQADQNKVEAKFDMQISNKSLTGNIDVNYQGYFKSDILNYLANSNQNTKEILSSFLTFGNQRLMLTEVSKQKNEYSPNPLQVSYTATINDWVKNVNGKLVLKPTILQPFSSESVDIDNRKFDLEFDKTYSYNLTYTYTIPQGYKVEYLPQPSTINNNWFTFEVNYINEKNTIKVIQTIQRKTLYINKSDLAKWNEILTEITKRNNQSIILSL